MPVPPEVKAFLLCRNVVRPDHPGRFKLEGLFTRVCGQSFPLVLSPCFLFIRLGSGTGMYRASVRLVHVASQETIACCEDTPFRVTSRLDTKDFLMETPPLLLPCAGRYDMQLFLDDQYHESATFDAVKVTGNRKGSRAPG
jgi:hypothetical protein